MTEGEERFGMDANRIDLWLKYVCLFRTRSEAAASCRGGHVKVEGKRVKPSSPVRTGDRVEITRDERVGVYEVTVVPERQVPRKEAGECYLDLSPPPPKRDTAIDPNTGGGRPTKKERRELRKLKGR
jgi:ribosome-associated heat shock protein Hsp15